VLGAPRGLGHDPKLVEDAIPTLMAG